MSGANGEYPPSAGWVSGWRGRKRWRSKYVAQGGRCAICGEPIPTDKMTKDHIVPLSHGGSTDWDNIQLTCEPCNARKGNSTPNAAGQPPAARKDDHV
jgi:5-methylcytosine-specific restriction endonuclease McrA